MTLLASQGELEDYLGRSRGTLDTRAATKALSGATTKIVAHLGYDPTYIVNDIVLTRIRRGQRMFSLPVPNVRAVASIEERTNLSTWQTVDPVNYAWDEDGTVTVRWYPWTWTDTMTLRITYSRGWQPLPAAMSDLACELAAGLLNTQPGISQEKLGGQRGYTVVYNSDTKLSDEQKSILAEFRQPAVA